MFPPGRESPPKLRRTVNSSKALDDDGPSSQVPGLQRRVLPAGALAVVVVPDHDPRQPVGLQRTGNSRRFSQTSWDGDITEPTIY